MYPVCFEESLEILGKSYIDFPSVTWDGGSHHCIWEYRRKGWLPEAEGHGDIRQHVIDSFQLNLINVHSSLVRVINYWLSFCLQRKMLKQRCTVQFQVRPVCNWREKPYQLPKYKCHLTGSSILGWTLERRGSHSTGDWMLLFAMGAWGPGASHEWDTKSVRAGGPRWRTMSVGAVFPGTQMFCLLVALRRAVHSDIAPIFSVLWGGPGDEEQNGATRPMETSYNVSVMQVKKRNGVWQRFIVTTTKASFLNVSSPGVLNLYLYLSTKFVLNANRLGSSFHRNKT